MPPLEVRRDARALTECILTVVGVASASLLLLWIWSAWSEALPPSHGVRPADFGTLTWFFAFLGSWVLMTAAMMLPSALPLLWTLQRCPDCGAVKIPWPRYPWYAWQKSIVVFSKLEKELCILCGTRSKATWRTCGETSFRDG